MSQSNLTHEEPASPQKKPRRWLRIIALTVVLVIIVAVAGFVIWASDASQPSPRAMLALESDALVSVTIEDGVVTFAPTSAESDTGLIFYPGGKVDYRAYAEPLRAIAEAGYLVLVPEMPLNLAFFGSNAAADLIEANPEVDNWVLGGHSLGGTAAALYAANSAETIDGLAFWASYPASDLTGSNLDFVTLYASNDGLATVDDIDNARDLLPADAEWILIEGGNHAQFGSYGEQSGDLPPTISEAEQHDLIVEQTLEQLERISQ